MYIGGGIFLLVVGAILAFGVNDSVDAINLEAIGWIMMGGGALAILLSLVLAQQRSNTSHREVIERRGNGLPPEREVVERRDIGGPPAY